MTAAPSATPAAASTNEGHGCLPRGYRLREFVIERVLGDGGFGVVYSALDLRLERRVAIKEYMPSSLARRDTDYSVQQLTSQRHRDAFEVGLRSFINEARMLARFEHPALIKVHQFWQEKGTAYMVMPFYAAPTLRNWVRARREPVTEAWLRTFLLQAMDALEVLHAASCMHRDIAPDNILVLDETKPLVLDFGAARHVLGDLRKALTVIVKPGFAPLEQYADTVKMRQGPWTDVYALAAVGHFIITGKAPAPAVSRVLADEVVPLRVRAKGRYSDALLGALDTALAVKPERRPQTMAAFRDLMLSTRPWEWAPTQVIRRTRMPELDEPVGRTSTTQPSSGQPATPAVCDDATTLVLHGAGVVPDLSAVAPANAADIAAAAHQPTATAPKALPTATAAPAMRRSAARFVDVGTLTQAVRASLANDGPHGRWLGVAGYATALAVFGGVLFMTSQLIASFVAANARGSAMATIVTRSSTAARSLETAAAQPAPAAPARVDATPSPVTRPPASARAPMAARSDAHVPARETSVPVKVAEPIRSSTSRR